MGRRVAVAEGLMTDVNQPLEKVRLLGVKCYSCGVILFGKRSSCENCGSKNLKEVVLSKKGKVWSYTVQRYPPPPPCRLLPKKPEEWKPRPVAWIDLPEGVRIIGIVDYKPEEMRIGIDVELVIEKGWLDEDGNEVIIYKFKPTG